MLPSGSGAWRRQFRFAVQIVDFYQARQHLGRLAEAQFGAGSEAGAAWVDQRETCP